MWWNSNEGLLVVSLRGIQIAQDSFAVVESAYQDIYPNVNVDYQIDETALVTQVAISAQNVNGVINPFVALVTGSDPLLYQVEADPSLQQYPYAVIPFALLFNLCGAEYLESCNYINTVLNMNLLLITHIHAGRWNTSR